MKTPSNNSPIVAYGFSTPSLEAYWAELEEDLPVKKPDCPLTADLMELALGLADAPATGANPEANLQQLAGRKVTLTLEPPDHSWARYVDVQMLPAVEKTALVSYPVTVFLDNPERITSVRFVPQEPTENHEKYDAS